MMMASGRSNFTRHARQIGNQCVRLLADDARLMERRPQTADEIRLTQPGQRRFAFLRRQGDDVASLLFWF
jgi:hypothetical protein